MSRERVRHCVTRQTTWLRTSLFIVPRTYIDDFQYKTLLEISKTALDIFYIAYIHGYLLPRWKPPCFKAYYVDTCFAYVQTSQPITWIKTMATAFIVGDRFRNKVTDLLENADSSLPQRLKEELVETLDKPEPTVLSFRTARELKTYLQDAGKSLMW